ncbi:DUF7134 domain-containing protein [Nonomuraea cavernae]|uniref:DUF7134 domain-containing protein n=1 Tax=Nonomuraea cavernae TaxID=2045107 RepID=UPI0034119D40
MRDAGLALALLAVCVLVNDPVTMVPKHTARLFGMAWPAGSWIWWGATLAAVAGVALRGRRPVPMLVLCVLSAAVHLALRVPVTIVDLATPVLLYTVAPRMACRGPVT